MAMKPRIDDLRPTLLPLTEPVVYEIGGGSRSDDSTTNTDAGMSIIAYLPVDGVIYAVNAHNGRVQWRAPVPDFMSTTTNTFMSVLDLSST